MTLEPINLAVFDADYGMERGCDDCGRSVPLQTMYVDPKGSACVCALCALWAAVMATLACMRDPRGELYMVTTGDDNMRDADEADLFGWVDDCEARLGFDVGDLRHAVVDYALARDGEDT